MLDLMGLFNAEIQYPVWDAGSLTLVDRAVPSEGLSAFEFEKFRGSKVWRTYRDEDPPDPAIDRLELVYLSTDPVLGSPYTGLPPIVDGNKFFITNIDPATTPDPVAGTGYPTFTRFVTTRSFARPFLSTEKPLMISGWVRMNSVNETQTNHGAKLTFMHEDNNSMYYAYILNTLSDGTPTEVSFHFEERLGPDPQVPAPALPTTIVNSFNNWQYGVRYRFDVLVYSSDIELYINGTLTATTSNSLLRAGNIGWRLDKSHVDFGDMTITGHDI